MESAFELIEVLGLPLATSWKGAVAGMVSETSVWALAAPLLVALGVAVLAAVWGHRLDPEESGNGEHRARRSTGGGLQGLLDPSRIYLERYRTLMDSVHDTVIFLGLDGVILDISHSVEEVLGFSPEEMVGREPFDLCHPEDLPEAVTTLEKAAATPGETHVVDLRFRTREGVYKTFEAVGRRPEGSEEVVIISRDVTERRLREKDLHRRAHYDLLTELPNRSHFLEELERYLERGAGDAGRAAVLFVDLDGFKAVNDELGHAAGDEVLRLVARRLRQATRERDLVARLGGDEFAVLLRGLDEGFRPETAARRLLRSLDDPFEVQGRSLAMRASVGIADGRPGEVGARQLVSAADLAMYRAKRLEGEHLARFGAVEDGPVTHRLNLRTELGKALRDGALEVRLQPIYDLTSGNVAGAETFPRWESSEGHCYEDEALVALAEEDGLVPELLATWMGSLQDLRRRLDSRRRSGEGDRPRPFFSFDLSGRHLRDPRVRSALRRALEDGCLSPGEVVVEVQELEIGDRATLAEAVEELGLTLAIDRFGTGCSCLSLVRRLQVDYLKVDRSLVEGVQEGEVGETILESVVGMAERLDVRVVAMAVEDRDLARYLGDLGCDLAQGSAFGGFLEPEEFLERVCSGSEPSSWVA